MSRLKNIRGVTIEINGEATNLLKELREAERRANELQKELREVDRALKLDPKNTELVAQKQRLLQEAVAGTSEKLRLLKDSERQLRDQWQNGKPTEEQEKQHRVLQREIVRTEADLKSLELQLRQSESRLSQFGEAAGRVGERATNLGKKFLPVTGAITGVGVAAGRMAMDFEDSMAQLNKIADTTVVPLDELRESILNLSNQTGISASELARVTYTAISAGQDTADAVGFVESATRLARAGLADTTQTVDLLTTVLNAYGKESSEVTRISDILIQTQDMGKITVGEMAANMGRVIPAAQAMGVSLEQVAAAYSITTANGINAAQSTTTINSLLNELGTSSSRTGQILREQTGRSFQQLMDDGYTLGDVLGIVQGHSEATGTEFNELWGNMNAGRAAMSLLANGADAFNENLERITNSGGATDEAFKSLDSTSFQLQQALNRIKNVGIELGGTLLDTLQPMIERITESIRRFSEWFRNLSQSQRETILIIGGIVAAIGPALMIFGKMATSLSAIIGFVTKYNVLAKAQAAVTKIVTIAQKALNFAFAASKIGLIVLVVTGVIAAFVALWNNVEGFRNFFINAGEAMRAAFFSAFGAIKNFFTQTLPNAFNVVIDFVKSNWQGLLLFLLNPFAGAFKLIYDNSEGFRRTIDNLIRNITTFFRNLWSSIVSIFSGAAAWFSSIFRAAFNGITSIFGAIGSWFGARWADITGVFANVGGFFRDRFRDAYNGVKEVFSGITGFFSGIWSNIKNTFTSIGATIGDAVGGAFRSVINGVLGTIEGTVNSAVGFINGAIGVINNIPGVSIGRIQNVSLPRLAKGGILRDGDAIVAEAGPELIRMMNGETIVMPLTAGARNSAVTGRSPESAVSGTIGGYTQNITINSPEPLSAYENGRQIRNQTRLMVARALGG